MHKKSVNYNQKCIVRDQLCGRVFGQSNICFVACPASVSVGFEVELLKTILLAEEIDPYLAVEDFHGAKEIFCTKICSKIIEARFCIVLLKDALSDNGIIIPNPNVYFEYGMMTSWRKCIVPLQPLNDQLAFNIQSLDTIKYTPNTFAENLKREVQTAILETSDIDGEDVDKHTDDILIAYFELNGLAPMRKSWLADNTNYRAFDNYNFGRLIGSGTPADTVFYQTKMILRRIERFLSDRELEIAGMEKSSAKVNTDAQRDGIAKAMEKSMRQMERAQNPTFTIVVPNAEKISSIEDRINNINSSLSLKVRVISLEDMYLEMNVA